MKDGPKGFAKVMSVVFMIVCGLAVLAFWGPIFLGIIVGFWSVFCVPIVIFLIFWYWNYFANQPKKPKKPKDDEPINPDDMPF
jgi:hypothetical protein